MGKPLDYNSFAQTYSETRSAMPWAANVLLSEISTLVKPAVILEIGCGTGNYIIKISGELPGNIYKGFDLSGEMLRIAKSKTDKIEFILADAEKQFPYDDNSIDATFLVDVIHHIVDYNNFFSECSRILKQGSKLIIFTDTEKDFAVRSGIKFFPVTLQVERERYPDTEELNKHSNAFNIKLISHEQIQRCFEIDDDVISRIGRKFSSSLRLISEEAFQRGIKRVKEAKLEGEKWVSSYTILKYQKQ